MPKVNLHEAKTHLSRLVEAASPGEEIVIAKAGKVMARLVPLRPSSRKERKPGVLKGKIWIDEDFDAPLTTGELLEWTDAPAFPPGRSK
ncbi:MAG: type II toxin-antitoxin system Phd/YefM family antitoxin [Acidobacteria bacterium]|nr:MAG: type II toxin-antitoxin system Phd/YefM family antitoxin [Acidobacteriota bacterium]RPJ63480.1 MAG: type II toxin-antitoxin system Phd/YefM family antitoxin [Acidobacteriota bacterium]